MPAAFHAVADGWNAVAGGWKGGLTATKTPVTERQRWLGGRTDCYKDSWEGGLTATRTAERED